VNPLVKVFLASTWKNDKRKKKNDNVRKKHLKGLWAFTRPHQNASAHASPHYTTIYRQH
jgi:hypothetical protein